MTIYNVIAMVVGIMAGMVTVLLVSRHLSAKANKAQGSQVVVAAAEAGEDTTATRMVLRIEGTQPVEGGTGFVKAYGLNPSEVLDVRMYARRGASDSFGGLPPRVRDCVVASYEQGFARGLEISEFVQGTRPLEAAEALYFALITPPQSRSVIVAFVGKAK